MAQYQTGTVTRLVRDRGFGFIRPDGSTSREDDLFFHRSGVRAEPGFSYDSMTEGMAVEYEIGESSKGPRAENITRA